MYKKSEEQYKTEKASPAAHKQSPRPAQQSLGSFRPQIARRIAEKVYKINWRKWEEVRRG